MTLNNQKIRILFFIGSLSCGGKERRLVELLTYLAGDRRYELMLVVSDPDPVVDLPAFYELNIAYLHIQKRWKRYDPTVFSKFYKICKQFRPRLIHTWGRVQSFYALPAVIGLGIPMINGQITSAPPNAARWSLNKIVDWVNFNFSSIILSNSRAGIDAYKPPYKKSRVIYNGVNLRRFKNLPTAEYVRSLYGIITPFVVVMVATFSANKDYELFFSIAKQITSVRDDITFIAVGDNGSDNLAFERFLDQTSQNPRIVLTGRITHVEAVINCSTIGVLFSNRSVHGEGISNSIIEYMSLARPVIANDAGGTREIVHDQVNGYLITNHTEDEIIGLITDLVDDPEKCTAFGNAGRKIIEESFSLDKMGKAFEETYHGILEGKLKKFPYGIYTASFQKIG
ncbi:MAG TPA: glycosyltransferase [Niastella sp.]